jgi:predicted N-acetyltransferase YhbS
VDFVVANLVDHAHFGPLLARWHALEWGHLYAGPGSNWDEQIAVEEFAGMQRSEIPLTLIALATGTNELLGSVSLIADDELQGYQHLTPWIASLFVNPGSRNHGIARVLMNRIVGEAARLGYDHVFLFSSGQEQYYATRGWETIDHASAHGHDVAVMSLSTQLRLE